MFHRTNSSALTLLMLLSVAAISNPPAVAHPVSFREPAEASFPSRDPSGAAPSTAPTPPVTRASTPPDSKHPIAPETRSVSVDQGNQSHDVGQGEAAWGWLIVSLMGVSLFAWQRLKGNRSDQSTIAAASVPPGSPTAIRPILKTLSMLFSNNVHSAFRSFRNTVLTDRLELANHNSIAESAVLVAETPQTQEVQEIQKTPIATETTPSGASSQHQPLPMEDCNIVIQPLILANSANGDTSQPGTIQPQILVRWSIPTDRKLALQQQGGKTLVLRVYDVTNINLERQPAHSFRQYVCEETVVDMVVPIVNLERDYVAEIGYLTQDGRLLKLTQSAQ